MVKKVRERKSCVIGRMREGRRDRGRERETERDMCGTKGERGRERERRMGGL